jgi:hypothetical protein
MIGFSLDLEWNLGYSVHRKSEQFHAVLTKMCAPKSGIDRGFSRVLSRTLTRSNDGVLRVSIGERSTQAFPCRYKAMPELVPYMALFFRVQ